MSQVHWLRRMGAQLRRPSRLLLIGANLAGLVLLIRWTSENIRADRLADQLLQIPASALAVAVAIDLLVLGLYGARMALILDRDFRASFSIVNLGFALNTLIPLRLGDALKIYAANRLYGIPLLRAFAASVTEKFADLLFVLLLLVAVTAAAAGEMIGAGVLLPITAIVAAGIVAFVLFRFQIVRIVKLLPKAGRVRRIALELHKHADGYPLARVLLASAAIWALNVALVYVSFGNFLPTYRLALQDCVALLLIMALAIAIPSAPAGIGLFEAGIVVFLTQTAGVGNEEALAAAAAFHLVVALPPIAILGWLLWSGGAGARPGSWPPYGRNAPDSKSGATHGR